MGLKSKGLGQDIQVKSASLSKFTFSPQNNNTARSVNFDQLRAQFPTTNEVEIDIFRQTGDLALFGNTVS